MLQVYDYHSQTARRPKGSTLYYGLRPFASLEYTLLIKKKKGVTKDPKRQFALRVLYDYNRPKDFSIV
jgi:hypothetical protein